LPCTRKPRQNIAMQAIMRRAESEQKQVTFKNISPVMEDENDRKIKTNIVSSINAVANKSTPILEISKVNEIASTNNALLNVPNRLPTMTLTSSANQHQPVSVQSQQRLTKLLPNVPVLAQINQLGVKEQQTQQIAQQMLPQMHSTMVAQCSQQTQQTTLGPVCYPNQSFNVQNPQFAKNFMVNRPSPVNAPRYQMQGQLNNGQSISALPQAVSGMHHVANQSRPLHQRMSQNVSHNTTQLLQQNIQLNSSAQQNIMSQNMNLQANNMVLQSNMNMEQQNHAIGLPQQQQSMIQNRSNNTQNQLSMNGSAMANISTMMSTLPMYEKNPQQQTLTTLSNSSSPTSVSNFQLGFNQVQTFNQSTLSQSQPFYKKDSDVIDFAFPNSASINKNQAQPQPQMNNYNMFCNYEPTEHFNLWKDNRSSQPSTTWWSSSNNVATQIHAKNSIVNDSAFSNWSDSINVGNMSNNRMLTAGKNYQQKGQHNRPVIGNTFENSRSFEVSNWIYEYKIRGQVVGVCN